MHLSLPYSYAISSVQQGHPVAPLSASSLCLCKATKGTGICCMFSRRMRGLEVHLMISFCRFLMDG